MARIALQRSATSVKTPEITNTVNVLLHNTSSVIPPAIIREVIRVTDPATISTDIIMILNILFSIVCSP